jgi:Fur family transcriptional regulator, peroxide stress response regulator
VRTKDPTRLLQDRIRVFKQVCKENGIKVTPQRIEIFLEIVDALDHPSAEDIHRRVRTRLLTISLDTVYRTLSTFESCGLIARVQFLEDKTRFDPNVEHHHHIFCTECKSIKDFYWPELDDADLPVEVQKWGRAQKKHLQVRGICSKCAQEKHPPKGSQKV